MTPHPTEARLLSIALAGALALVTVGPGPAYADDLALSFDGQHWRDDLRRPLFDPGLRWVPGDRAVETFYVRDDGPTGATMTIAIRTSDPDELLSDRDIAIAARLSQGEWIPLHNGADVGTPVGGGLDRAEVVRVDVSVDFLWASANPSMAEQLPMDLVVTLAQAGVEPDGDSRLPDTGSDVSRWLLVLGATLLGSGIALVAGRRRGERADG